MVERILVPFSGEGSGVEELTWGMKGMWQTMWAAGESRTMSGIDVLPPGKTVQDAADTLSFVMSRHQSLRTRLLPDGKGGARQVLSDKGEAPLEIVDAGDRDPAVVAEEVRDGYQSRNFDYEHEWPVRMAVIRKDGELTHAVVVYLHTSMDAFALSILMSDLANMAAGERAEPVTAVQPLELARRQRAPASRRQCEASLRHLERVMRAIPRDRFTHNGAEPTFATVGHTSPAAYRALRLITERHRIDSSPVLLAAYAVSLTRVTGNNPFVAVLAVSNRFRPGFGDSVSPLAQVSPCVIDVADVTLGEALSRAWRAATTAYKHAYYDPDERVATLARVNAEIGPVDLSCFFNDRRDVTRNTTGGPVPTAEEIVEALPRSELYWNTEPAPTRQKLYLDANDAVDAVNITASVNTSYLSKPQAEALVRGIEEVVVAMALDPAAATGVRSEPVPALS
ncbi:MAG TPA: condensation domain-containing protein [Pseudonocardiaceae bacterium]